jgi:hypothetical protein
MAFTVNEVKTIKLTNGEELKLPRMTISKILAVTNAISVLVKAVKKEYPDLFKNDTADITQIGMHVLRFLPEMLPVVGDQIILVIATYLGKNPDWVADTMDAEDLVNVATPFLQTIMSQGNHLLGAINKGFAVEAPPSPNQSTTQEEKPSEPSPT